MKTPRNFSYPVLLAAALAAAVNGHLLAASIHNRISGRSEPATPALTQEAPLDAAPERLWPDMAFLAVGAALFMFAALKEHSRAKRLLPFTLSIALGSHFVGLSLHSLLERFHAPWLPTVTILASAGLLVILLIFLLRHHEDEGPVWVNPGKAARK